MEGRAASGSLGIACLSWKPGSGGLWNRPCSYSTRSSDFCLCQYRYLGVYFTCYIHFQACPCRVYQVGSKVFVRMLTVQGGWPAPCGNALPAPAAPKLEGGPTVEEPQERCSSYSHRGFSRAARAG